MSGVEVVGLLLGAFPLAISAMEHYEDMRKVSGTFFNIRRAHRKDLGKLKNCQVMFKLNLQQLLIPLLRDQVVTKMEYEQLLAEPGGDGWKEGGVDDALAERLADGQERYVEILEDMVNTMTKMCEAVRVDDPVFQEVLARKQNVSASCSPETRYT